MSRSERGGQSATAILIEIATTALAIVVFLAVWPQVSDGITENAVKGLTGQPTQADRTEERAVAADAKFVPTAQRRFPRLTAGVPVDRLAKAATGTCDLLDGTYGADTKTQAAARAVVRPSLSHGNTKPTRAQVNQVIRLATTTTCPTKGYLADQFQ
jgi:hypothetical protein